MSRGESSRGATGTLGPPELYTRWDWEWWTRGAEGWNAGRREGGPGRGPEPAGGRGTGIWFDSGEWSSGVGLWGIRHHLGEAVSDELGRQGDDAVHPQRQMFGYRGHAQAMRRVVNAYEDDLHPPLKRSLARAHNRLSLRAECCKVTECGQKACPAVGDLGLVAQVEVSIERCPNLFPLREPRLVDPSELEIQRSEP